MKQSFGKVALKHIDVSLRKLAADFHRVPSGGIGRLYEWKLAPRFVVYFYLHVHHIGVLSVELAWTKGGPYPGVSYTGPKGSAKVPLEHFRLYELWDEKDALSLWRTDCGQPVEVADDVIARFVDSGIPYLADITRQMGKLIPSGVSERLANMALNATDGRGRPPAR